MKTLKIVPDNWPCSIFDCPPGFFVYKDQLCFKTEYGDCECFNSIGETFCKDNTTEVQPVVTEWCNDED